jgi:methionyl-tRNA formyltransferase
VLDALAMVNIHFSLLPRWRGRHRSNGPSLAGDETTGVCVMAVEEGLDTGGIYSMAEVPIGPEQTADELRRELVVGLARACWSMRCATVSASRPSRSARRPTPRSCRRPTTTRLDGVGRRPAPRIRLGQAWTTLGVDASKIASARISEPGASP